MRCFLFLLLSIHLCSTVYGQEAITTSCDEYPSLREEFSESLEEFRTRFDELNDEQKNNHINVFASILWYCSDAQEFNSILLDTLDIYSTEPRIRVYILRFLEALSSNYKEIETYNEDNNWANRATNASWKLLLVYGVFKIAFRSRFGFLANVSKLREFIFIGSSSVATGAVYEWAEEDLSVKFDPSVLSASLIAMEMHDLQNSSCELEEELKTTDIPSKESFDELALTHKSLRDTYAMLAEERPGFSPTQNLDLPPEVEEEIYAEFYHRFIQNTWKPADPDQECLNRDRTISLDMTRCYLEESARMLNNSFFSTEPIRFGSGFASCLR